MKPLPESLLYYYHDFLTACMIGVWFIFAYLGYSLKNDFIKKRITYFLIFFSIMQEILDWINRLFLDQEYSVSLGADLPLQYCVIGFYFSILCLYFSIKKNQINSKLEQFLFDCSYVLGFAGGLQALIAVDLTGINNMLGAFALNWAHSLIILNVIWLIFAYNKRFEFLSIFRAYAFIVLAIFPVGLVNYVLRMYGIEANYMFICEPPNVDSSFFIGGWPNYIFWLAIIYFIYVFVLYLPFFLLKKYNFIK